MDGEISEKILVAFLEEINEFFKNHLFRYNDRISYVGYV